MMGEAFWRKGKIELEKRRRRKEREEIMKQQGELKKTMHWKLCYKQYYKN